MKNNILKTLETLFDRVWKGYLKFRNNSENIFLVNTVGDIYPIQAL